MPIDVSDAMPDAVTACKAAVEEFQAHPTAKALCVAREAPAGTLSASLQEQVPLFREQLESSVLPTFDEATRMEAEAHLDDFTLARFLLAREQKLVRGCCQSQTQKKPPIALSTVCM